MSANRCQQMRITNSHQQAMRGLKEVQIGAAPYRGAPISTKAAAVGSLQDLLKAIDDCCRLRGDTDDNRIALRRECSQMPASSIADLIEHFNGEAQTWARVTGQAL